MAEIITMPRLGSTMKEGTIIEWLKKEGDHIDEGEELFVVETSKLTNEVESEVEGFLLKILAEAADEDADETAAIPCQSPVCIIGEKDEDISDLLEQCK
ncbi:MAG: hypothetical protein GX567_06945 [Clostridia bacterium]|nr:hypothetical protein [Clostridia bacterium]